MTIFKMDNGWTDHSTEGPVDELYEKEFWSVCKALGPDQLYHISGYTGETFATTSTAETAMAIVDALVAGGDDGWPKRKGRRPKAEGPKRFTVARQTVGGRVERHHVYDEALQFEAFHWYGQTGEAKCNAVAAALNALGHERD